MLYSLRNIAFDQLYVTDMFDLDRVSPGSLPTSQKAGKLNVLLHLYFLVISDRGKYHGLK